METYDNPFSGVKKLWQMRQRGADIKLRYFALIGVLGALMLLCDIALALMPVWFFFLCCWVVNVLGGLIKRGVL